MANKKLPAENQTLKNVIYILIQCSWGLPQTLLGFIVLLIILSAKIPLLIIRQLFQKPSMEKTAGL